MTKEEYKRTPERKLKNRRGIMTRNFAPLSKGDEVEIKRKYNGLGCLLVKDREVFVQNVPFDAVKLIGEE